MISLPIDEGELEISVVDEDATELSKTAIISIIDQEGRTLFFEKELLFSAWLPLDLYRIVVEYEGVKFDEIREVRLEEPTLVEIRVPAE